MSKANFFDVLCDIEYNIGIYGCRSMTFPMSHAILHTCFSAAGSWAHRPCSCGKLEYDSELEIFKLSWKSSSFALFSST